MATGYPNFYNNFPLHPHNRFHGTSVTSAYTRNNSQSWSSANTTANSGASRQLKNVRRIEPSQLLHDYRHGRPQGQPHCDNLSAPIYATKPKNSPYDGKAAYDAIKARIQETQRKRGNLIEGTQRPISQKPKVWKQPKIPRINNIDFAQPTAGKVSRASSATGVKPQKCASKLQAPPAEPKPSVALKPTNFKIAIDAAAPPTIRSAQTKPAPNANNDWSTNYNDDFKNWPAFTKGLKNKPGVDGKDAGVPLKLAPSITTLSQTSNANKEKRKLMERLRREQEKQELLNTEKALEMNKKSPRSKTPPNEKENNENAPTSRRLEKPKPSASRYQKVKDPRIFSSETTNSSTYQRWPKSAFQTVQSRDKDRPVWANQSTHFPRKKVLKDSTKHNMNITLCVDGKNMGSQSKLKTTEPTPSQKKRSVFQTEYMRTYKPLAA